MTAEQWGVIKICVDHGVTLSAAQRALVTGPWEKPYVTYLQRRLAIDIKYAAQAKKRSSQ
jgi:hypothetical protein